MIYNDEKGMFEYLVQFKSILETGWQLDGLHGAPVPVFIISLSFLHLVSIVRFCYDWRSHRFYVHRSLIISSNLN